MESSGQTTRSPKTSCGTKTPTQSPTKPSNTSLQRSPIKTPISAEMRARMEENRKRAQEIKIRKQQMARLQEQADQEADRRAAGEKCLREFGLASTPQQKLEPSTKNLTSHHLEDFERSLEFDANLPPPPKLPPPPYSPDPKCSAEQLKVLDLVKLGRNVFFTGSAGVGKSFMLHEVVRMLKSDRRRVSVTAPTGIAALAIGGSTIHSWAKVGLGQGSVHTLYNKLLQNKLKGKKFNNDSDDNRIWNTDVLIVDEISMLHPDLFEKVSILCQAIRQSKEPFGGIQIILSGDFFQLPPVAKDDSFTCMYCGCPKFERIGSTGDIRCVRPLHKQWDEKPCGRVRKEYTFCFETPTWLQLKLQVIELTKVFRQEDKHFIDMLNKIRWGTVDDEVEQIAVTRSQPLEVHKIKPTRLYARNTNVHAENEKQFNLLESQTCEFFSSDQTIGKAPYAHTFMARLDDLQVRKKLPLKIGAQVMLLCNLDIKAKLVNGSRGVVIDWVERSGSHLPTTLTHQRDPDAMKKMLWCSRQANKLLPKVLFSDGRIMLIEPFVWEVEIDKQLTLCRTQLPLSLAWAITIHKSQGQSLDRLCVDLFGIFEHGQAYVALSRARSLEGLQITGWKSSRVQCHPSVKDFYKSLHEEKPYDRRKEDFLNPEHFFPYPQAIWSASAEYISSDEDIRPNKKMDTLPEKGAHMGVDLISSDWVKSLCSKAYRANATSNLDESIGSHGKPRMDSKIHIDPLLGGSSPSMSDDLPDAAELISAVQEAERSQGEQRQQRCNPTDVDQVEQSEKKGGVSTMQSIDNNQSIPEIQDTKKACNQLIPKIQDTCQDLYTPTLECKNRLTTTIETIEHEPVTVPRPKTKRKNRTVPRMEDIDNGPEANSPRFTLDTKPTSHEIRAIQDQILNSASTPINKDRSIPQVSATESKQCMGIIPRGQCQPSAEIQAIDQNQVNEFPPTNKRKGKRKLSELNGAEGIAFIDLKPFSKRASTTQAKPLVVADLIRDLEGSSHTNFINGPPDFGQPDPSPLPRGSTGHTNCMNGLTGQSSHADYVTATKSTNPRKDRRVAANSKPNTNQAETIAIPSDPQLPLDESELAKTILNDLSRRIRNSICRLNKSLLDLPSGQSAQEFDLHSVDEHVRMLVAENFYNPHLESKTVAADPGPRLNENGTEPNLDDRDIEDGNTPRKGGTFANYHENRRDDSHPLDSEGTYVLSGENDRIDEVFDGIPPEFSWNSSNFAL
ncbi:hypothetical protein MJO29_008142 [Puccinia striiformis f. sp. tritici]|uniref:ATP-dependent DNA helicase n=1 Tax=Puccinia striiformis f. sp. tritici PST-78 TaxID=1165861 RepID=A0A0L0V0N5_9BASI|nr:hypothetical protein MJO29_008142 [Puccinia striiformis f. sp. tritici]KNE92746.1 hypothetical protein PSTG_13877 [Puccinia striiformis f. sp. tritici PST-78]